ncbi:MAG: cytochrome C oxidase subunit IV family protein [Saprospiraceae bacterium]|nr:cytochrome C oxidase subunit IV family protein [Saprospiraceae bacterium]
MSHLSYKEAKSKVLKVILILGVITIVEVLFALLGKGYIIEGVHFPTAIMGLAMIIMSFVKAYLIVYEFMHMKYEVPGLVKSVLLPTLLLVWAIIAFFYEGNTWKNYRAAASKVEERVDPPGTLKAEDIKSGMEAQQESHSGDSGDHGDDPSGH